MASNANIKFKSKSNISKIDNNRKIKKTKISITIGSCDKRVKAELHIL